MTDAPTDYDPTHPSSAEGEDPADGTEREIVLQSDGKPSAAEGEDPDATAEVHEVLNPVDPE